MGSGKNFVKLNIGTSISRIFFLGQAIMIRNNCLLFFQVSKDAKDLIKGMLKTNPQERLAIDDVIRNKWIAVSLYVDFSLKLWLKKIVLRLQIKFHNIGYYFHTGFFYNSAEKLWKQLLSITAQ